MSNFELRGSTIADLDALGPLMKSYDAQGTAEIWNIPGVHRPNFWARLGRTGCMMLLLGVFLLVSTVLAGEEKRLRRSQPMTPT